MIYDYENTIDFARQEGVRKVLSKVKPRGVRRES